MQAARNRNATPICSVTRIEFLPGSGGKLSERLMHHGGTIKGTRETIQASRKIIWKHGEGGGGLKGALTCALITCPRIGNTGCIMGGNHCEPSTDATVGRSLGGSLI